MTSQHTTVLRLRGIVYSDASDVEIVNLPEIGLRAVLTSNADPYCDIADRGAAIISLMARGFRPGTHADLGEAVFFETAAIAEERRQRFPKGPFLVVKIHGQVPDFTDGKDVEREDFVVRVGGASKEKVRASSAHVTSSLLAAMTIIAKRDLVVDKVSGSYTITRDDGKVIYPVEIRAGIAEMIISSPLPAEADRLIPQWFESIYAHPDLERVVRLFVDSIEIRKDRLRAFLAAWTAMEMFINKSYSLYERGLYSEGKESKNSLAGRFAVIAMQLAPAEADEDLVQFNRANKLRNRLVHGAEVREESLPLDIVQPMLKKYLALHLSRPIALEQPET